MGRLKRLFIKVLLAAGRFRKRTLQISQLRRLAFHLPLLRYSDRDVT